MYLPGLEGIRDPAHRWCAVVVCVAAVVQLTCVSEHPSRTPPPPLRTHLRAGFAGHRWRHTTMHHSSDTHDAPPHTATSCTFGSARHLLRVEHTPRPGECTARARRARARTSVSSLKVQLHDAVTAAAAVAAAQTRPIALLLLHRKGNQVKLVQSNKMHMGRCGARKRNRRAPLAEVDVALARTTCDLIGRPLCHSHRHHRRTSGHTRLFVNALYASFSQKMCRHDLDGGSACSETRHPLPTHVLYTVPASGFQHALHNSWVVNASMGAVRSRTEKCPLAPKERSRDRMGEAQAAQQ